jgi:hypothetical protein
VFGLNQSLDDVLVSSPRMIRRETLFRHLGAKYMHSQQPAATLTACHSRNIERPNSGVRPLAQFIWELHRDSYSCLQFRDKAAPYLRGMGTYNRPFSNSRSGPAAFPVSLVLAKGSKS